MQQDHTQAHACLSRVLVLARQTHHPQEEDENTSVHDFLKYVFSFPHQRIIGTSKFGIIKIRKKLGIFYHFKNMTLCDVNSDKIFDILVIVSATELLFGSPRLSAYFLQSCLR